MGLYTDLNLNIVFCWGLFFIFTPTQIHIINTCRAGYVIRKLDNFDFVETLSF